MMVKIIEIQRIVVTRCCEILIHCHGKDGEIRVEIESFLDASDELLQGNIETVAREIAMVGESVDTGTWTST